MRRPPPGLVRQLLTALAGFLAGGLLFYWLVGSRIERLEELQAAGVGGPVSIQATGLPAGLVFEPTTDFLKAASRSVDAVVFISTRIGNSDGQYLPDVFGLPQRGSGSGVIISRDGYIVTNNHVVEGAATVTVSLNNMQEYEAEIVATDPNTDLAVIKINADSLPMLRFADSDLALVGHWVLAVGNPFNLTSTVTAGIISAKARNIGVLRGNLRQGMGAEYAIESFIQTDAAVNPGNSGGALVNLDGDLVGINTAIATETGSYQGYSFAVPSNLVRKVVADLIQHGVVQRGFIGVSIRDIDASTASRRNLGTRQGAYVADLSANGAARAAGIQIGDVIIAVNNKPVRSASELQEQIANYRPGDEVHVRLIRNGQRLEIGVVLCNQRGGTGLLNGARRDNRLRNLGAQLKPISDEAKHRFRLEHGLQVAGLDARSPLRRVGVEVGFIITQVDRQPVATLEDLRRLLSMGKGLVRLDGIKPNGRPASYVVDAGG